MIIRYFTNPIFNFAMFGRPAGVLEGILSVVGFVVGILFAMAVHEMGHAFIAYNEGDYTAKYFNRLTLNPFRHIDIYGFAMLLLVGFGWAKPVPINPSNFKNYKRGMVLVSLAGIVFNLISAFLVCGIYGAFLLLIKLEIVMTSIILYSLFYVFAVMLLCFILISVSLALFNIIPLFPLDGYRLVECFVGGDNKIMTFVRQYSMPILIIILLLGNFTNFDIFGKYINFVGGGIKRLYSAFWGLFGFELIGV